MGHVLRARSVEMVGLVGSRNQLESLDFRYRTSGILSPLSPLRPQFWTFGTRILDLCLSLLVRRGQRV